MFIEYSMASAAPSLTASRVRNETIEQSITNSQPDNIQALGPKQTATRTETIADQNNNTASIACSESRYRILEELKKLGVNVSVLDPLSIEELANLLFSITDLLSGQSDKKRPGRPKRREEESIILTSTDKAILSHLFSSDGHVSSLQVSKALEIPLSTIQRRRKRLEEELVETRYSVKLEKLGWRRAILMISITSRNATEVGKEIMEMDDKIIESASRMLGENSVDLLLNIVFQTNEDIVALIDKIKCKDGIRNVWWSEAIETIGTNQNIQKRVVGIT